MNAAGLLLGDGETHRYEVSELLGVGATGEVYTVRDQTLGRLLAVKVLQKDLAASPAGLASFIAEARITASLSHPNVLPVHDFDLAVDGRPYFSMSRISGRSLGAALAESTVQTRHPAIATLNRVVSIAIDICNAAAYAHHRSIVHQDIKPDNIMLGDFGEVLLVDWGSASPAGPDGRVTGPIYGTPLYMSPEQARREHCDARSDIYCIGATIFHALVLRLPIWSDDPDEFWASKRAGTITPPSPSEAAWIPAELRAIAMRAMEAVPGARYQSAEDLKRDLENYQAGLAVTAHRPSAWHRFRRWHHQHRALFWTVAAATTAVALVLSQLLLEWRKERSSWRQPRNHPSYLMSTADGRIPALRAMRRPDWISDHPFVEIPCAKPEIQVSDGGILVTAGKSIIDLINTERVRGDVAVEWEYESRNLAGDLNCFIGGDDREHAFTFHVGGFERLDQVTLTHDGDMLLSAPLRAPLQVGRRYRFRMEHDDRHVRLAIDGRRILDWYDAEDVGGGEGQRFGFDAVMGHILWIGDLQVWSRTAAQRISPLQIGDKLLRLSGAPDTPPALRDRDIIEAENVNREIISAYDGTDLATRATFRVALCQHKEGKDRLAAESFLQFATRWPDHELAPFALSEAADAARTAKAPDLVTQARTRLVQYQGSPAQLTQFYHIAAELSIDLHGMSPEASVPGSIAAVASLNQWRQRYHAPTAASELMAQELIWPLILEHRSDEVLHLPIIPPKYGAESLCWMGRFAEALARFGSDPVARADTLYQMGRLRECAELDGGDLNLRMLTLYHLGDFDAMRTVWPGHQLVEELPVYAGSPDRFIAAETPDPQGMDYGLSPRCWALLAAGRYTQILTEYAHPSARAFALIGLGRLDDVIALQSPDPVVRGTLAVALAQRGELARARDLLCRFEDVNPPWVISNWTIRTVLMAASGDMVAARAFLEHVMTTGTQVDWLDAWHLSAFALGRMDEATFLAQPFGFQVDARLEFARALRLEVDGHPAEAAAHWLTLLAMPHWRRDLFINQLALVRWRVLAAGLSLPPGPLVPAIGICYR